MTLCRIRIGFAIYGLKTCANSHKHLHHIASEKHRFKSGTPLKCLMVIKISDDKGAYLTLKGARRGKGRSGESFCMVITFRSR